jgi:hypothetical protein
VLVDNSRAKVGFENDSLVQQKVCFRRLWTFAAFNLHFQNSEERFAELYAKF